MRNRALIMLGVVALLGLYTGEKVAVLFPAHPAAAISHLLPSDPGQALALMVLAMGAVCFILAGWLTLTGKGSYGH